MELRGPGVVATFTASGNMNTDTLQFRFVKQAAGVDEDVFISTTSGAVCVGVNQDKVLDNQHVRVTVGGFTKIRLASSLGAGIWLADGAGWGVQYTAASAGVVLGRLITGATSGTPGEMIFSPAIVGSGTVV